MNKSLIASIIVLFCLSIGYCAQSDLLPEIDDQVQNNTIHFEHLDNNFTNNQSPPRRDRIVYTHGFEDGWEDWTTEDLRDHGLQWHLSREHAFDGMSFWCGNEEVGGYENQWLQHLISPPLDLSGHQDEPSSLRFKLNYGLESPDNAQQPYDGWDGCNVWISIDNGENWEVLEPDEPRYNCENLYSFGEEWQFEGETPGWGGSSDGWVDAVFDLNPYLGNRNVRIRWTLCTDPAWDVHDEEALIGMLVDNIVVTAGRELVYRNEGEENGMEYAQAPVPGDHWEISNDDAHDGDFSAHCPVEPNLYNALISPPLQLPADRQIHFSFWVHTHMIVPDGNDDGMLDDFFRVHLSDDGGETWFYVIYDYCRNDEWRDNWMFYTGGVWFGEEPQWAIDMDLSQWAGQEILLRWVVYTDDNMEGDQGTGLWIDDILIEDNEFDVGEVAIGEAEPIGRTWYEAQANGCTGKTITVDADGGIHAVWTNALNAEWNDRNVSYNAYEGDEWIIPLDEFAPVDDGGRSGYANISMTSENRAAVFYHNRPGGENVTRSEMGIDFLPMIGAFANYSIDTDDVAALWPHGAISSNDHAHVMMRVTQQGVFAPILYAHGIPDEDLQYEFDGVVEVVNSTCFGYNVIPSRFNDRTALVYLAPAFNDDEFELWEQNGGAAQASNDLYVIESENGEDFNWNNPINVTSFIRPDPDADEEDPAFFGDQHRVYAHTDGLYDEDENLHLVFVTVEFIENPGHENDQVARSVNVLKSRLWHWKSGMDEFQLIADAWYEPEAERDSWWLPNISNPSIGLDDEGNLYCVFAKYPEAGDVAANGFSNFDIFATVSEDGGETWAQAVNITETDSPGANPGACLSEIYPSLAERVTDELHISYILDLDVGISALGGGERTHNFVMYHKIETGDIPREPLVENIPFHIEAEEGEIPDLRHFVDFEITDVNHSLLVNEIVMDGEVVPTGWEVGVFTPEGTLAGGGVWVEGEMLGFPAWGDDPETEDIIEGFRANEEMSFMMWDDVNDHEYPVDAEFLQGNAIWQANGFTAMEFEVISARELAIPLNEGWNMISINVSPSDEMYADDEDRGPDVILMTEQLRIDEDNHHVLLLKNGLGQFYSPSWNFCNIPYWNLSDGYLVKVDEDVEAVWSGEPIAADAPINLREGWNMVAYFPQYELDASAPDFYVLSPIIDNVLMAKDGEGRFLNTQFRFSNMQPWRETLGYMIKTDANLELGYPEEENVIASIPTTVDSYYNLPFMTDRNMSVLVDLSGMTGENDQIAAFNASGMLVGTGVVDEDGRCGLAVFGDDESTDRIDGLQEEESFTLRLYDAQRNVESRLKVQDIRSGRGLVYKTNDFCVVKAAVESIVPDEYYLSQAYPNPFNNLTRLRFGLPQASNVTVSVYDISGRLVANLVNDQYIAGHHSFVWDAADVSAGIYMIELSAGEFSAVVKVSLVK